MCVCEGGVVLSVCMQRRCGSKCMYVDYVYLCEGGVVCMHVGTAVYGFHTSDDPIWSCDWPSLEHLLYICVGGETWLQQAGQDGTISTC